MANSFVEPWELCFAPDDTLVAAHQRVQLVPSTSSQHDVLLYNHPE